MRDSIVWTAIAGIAILSSAMASADAVELPKRKPGHWRITTISQDTGMQTIDACIGPDDSIAALGEGSDCSAPTVTAAGSEVIVDVVCTTPGGKQTISAAYGGDFNSRYHAVMKMRFDPPPPDAAPTLGATIDGKYVGPECSPDAR